MALLDETETFDIGGEDTVRRMGYGAMRLTGEDIIGKPDDPAEARRVVERVVDLGVDFVDTADSYGPGVSERILGETLDLTGDDADVLVATKGGLLRNPESDWISHGDPDYLRNAVMCSLDRLRVDEIDLYQFHRPDPDTLFTDSLHALAELKDRGLIRHIGVSNVTVDQLEAARDVVEVATVQNRYNVADREHEDVLDACESLGIGFIPWFPLGAGDLGDRAGDLDAVADAHDATRRQVALAWLLRRSPVTLPIPGTSSVEHLEENVAASTLANDLTDDEVARLR